MEFLIYYEYNSLSRNNELKLQIIMLSGISALSALHTAYLYPSLRKKYGNNPSGALKYFVKYGMKKMHQASAAFNVKSYVNEYASLRRKYRTNWKKYYLHFIKTGSKKGWHGTGCSKMKKALTVYKGKNYKKIYDFNYYIAHYKKVKKKYQYDDYGALEYFVKHGRAAGHKAKK